MALKPYYKDDISDVMIYNCDCRDVLREIAKTEDIQLVFADPPYGVGVSHWDTQIVPVDTWLPICREIAKTVLITCGNSKQHMYPEPDWIASWFRPGSVQRAHGGDEHGPRFSHWEPVLIYGSNPLWVDAKQIANEPGRRSVGHPCPKPLALMRWLLSDATDRYGTVLDPFMGSGTTLLAAMDLKRRAIGIEIDSDYCDIAIRQISQRQMSLKFGA